MELSQRYTNEARKLKVWQPPNGCTGVKRTGLDLDNERLERIYIFSARNR